MGTLWTRVRRLLEIEPIPAPPLDVEDEGAFRDHARALTRRNLQLTALAILLSSAACIPADRLVYPGAPQILRLLLWLRVGHVASAAAAYAALRYTPLARRSMAVANVVLCFEMTLLGSVAGLLGDFGSPWFHFSYCGMIGLLPPLVPLPSRALLGAVFSGSLVAGFAIARPFAPPHPMMVPSIAFLLIVTAAGVGAGHVIYRLVRQVFLDTRARERTNLAFEALNRTLEERVRAQTHELRMLAAHLESAREDERVRIARELHDELGQELTALRYALTFTRQRFERDPASIRPNLDEIESLTGRAATTTRQIVSDLRPRILDDLGLDAGVEWLLKRTEERAGLVCRLVTSSRRLDVDVDVSIAAFRILQESLTNVVRHAQAAHVDVEIQVEGEELRLRVRDDGIGMKDPEKRRIEPGKGGMGLVGMRERVSALGGALRLESGAGLGTTIDVRLPLPSRRAAAEGTS
jgi:signal transduction histidine kinase